jgi:hypothetical protein
MSMTPILSIVIKSHEKFPEDPIMPRTRNVMVYAVINPKFIFALIHRSSYE